MTREDLDRLAALVAASDKQSADGSGDRPWRAHETYYGDIVDNAGACVVQDVPTNDDRDALIALYNAAPDLLALAIEALEARETYRLEWAGLYGTEEWSVIGSGPLAWCRGRRVGLESTSRIVRERDGEVVS